MKRRGKKKRSPELIAMQERFWLEVVLGGEPEGAALPCWYAEHLEDAGPCEGRIIGSHFIKRQRIGNAVFALGARGFDVQRAEWDPRFAVAGCQCHDDRWDGHRMPPLVIWRHQVPELIELAATEWSIVGQIDHRCPPFSPACRPAALHPTNVPINQGGTQ